MTVKKSVYKLRWKAWELAYAVALHVIGQRPITWSIKHKRNTAFVSFKLLR